MKWLQELPGNATQRWMPVSGTSGAPPSLATAPSLCLPPPLASSAWLSHSSATLKNFQKCIVSTQSGKLSLPKPSGRVAWGLSVRGSSSGMCGMGGRWGKQSSFFRRVVRSTFSASMRVYFTAKAFTNEWMSASKTAKQATPPPPSPSLSLALRLASFSLFHRPSLLLQVAYASGRQPFVEPLFLVRRALS